MSTQDVSLQDIENIDSSNMLDRFSVEEQYNVYPIKKKSGGVRMIEAPCDELKEAQKASLARMQRIYMDHASAAQAFTQFDDDLKEALKKTVGDQESRAKKLAEIRTSLSQELIDNKPVLQYAHYAHAFCRGRNIASGAKPHVGANTVITADLSDFFPSIKWNHFNPDGEQHKTISTKSYKNMFAYVFGNAKMKKTGAWLQAYITHILPELKMHFCDFHDGKGLRLPQGAPASPFLSNVLMCRFDYRAGWKCYPQDVQYTRYADDLIFSGENEEKVRRAYAATVALLVPLGLKVNKRKYTFKTGHQRKKILGLVVNEKLNTPRYFRRRLRAAQHHCRVIYTLESLGRERGFKVPKDLRPFFLAKTEGVSFGEKMNKVVKQLQDQGAEISMEDLQSKKLRMPKYWYTKKIAGHSAFQNMIDNPPITEDSMSFCEVQKMLAMA